MGGPPKAIGTDETISTGGMDRGDPRKSYDLPAGMMVGEYRVEGQLGEGGMGKVYAAMHPVIAKRAAIKVLHPELSVNTEAVERFIQEARSVNQIGHPNIVDIFAFGALPDGRSYFVMEWLRGESLRDRVRRGRLGVNEALQILDTIAVALEAAHEKGIVHRDLKPDNVFLVEVKSAAPQVKLLDFGIAKLLGNDDMRAERTRTGNLLGTPAYISPEQARGYAVDHRTDIYALGALAYELFTGSLPFPSDNAADMIAKHLFEAPPHANARNPQIPPEIDGLLCAMLAKDVNARPTLEQVRGQLRLFSNHLLMTGGAGMQTPLQADVGRASNPSLGVHHTPSPLTMQTPAGPVAAYRTAPPQQTKSRLPIIIVAGLIAGGLGVAAFLAFSNKSEDSKDAPATTEPVNAETKAPPPGKTVEPAKLAEPATPVEATKPVEPTKPVEATKPVETTKPVEPTKPVETTKPTELAKPAGTTDPAGTTEPAEPTKPGTAAQTKPETTKPIVKKRTPKPGTKTKPGAKPVNDDPDAPM